MRKTVYALASTAALALGVMASSTPAAAQSTNYAPAVYPWGPSYFFAPAYYVYVPARRPANPAGYADVASPASGYVLYDDVYPPAIYGPQLRPQAPRQ